MTTAHLEQIRHLTGYTLEEAVTDRGNRGKKEIGGTRFCELLIFR